MTIRDQIKNLISEIVGRIDFSVEVPEEKAHGDYATNIALIFSRQARDEWPNPIQLAEEIKSKIQSDLFEKIEVAPPGFINFFLKPEFLQNQLKEILKQDKSFGRQDIGKKKTVIIDYSSPNIAKPMHVGHLRSTIIGQAIYNIYKFLGYKVVGDNHLGDWGTQFGIMIAACKKYKINFKKITIKEMLDIYVRFNQEIEDDPNLRKIAKSEFKKLEDGDRENRKIWKILKEKSSKEFERFYKILGVKFELVLGESFYENKLQGVIKNALNKGVAVKNPDNSIVIPLKKFGLIDCLIQKSDGATLYETRDLATIKYRVKKYNPDIILYVVGNEQTFHFQQLFQSAELLNYVSKDKLHHIKFGLILDENRKKLATRKGRVIDAEELIDKAIDLAKQVIKEKNPKLSEKERAEAAQIIGVGALKYNDLSQNRQTDIIFNWQKMLSFEGNSGPYLQYSYVRLRSILRKAGALKSFNPKFLKEKEELEIIKELIKFPEIIKEASEKFQINLLANYLYNLAGLINAFYEKLPVLKAEKDTKLARLALIKSAVIVSRNGLNLLGMEVLEKM